MTRLLLVSLALTACAPQQIDTWAALLDLPDVDANDPQAIALAAEAWCQHGAELAEPRPGCIRCAPRSAETLVINLDMGAAR